MTAPLLSTPLPHGAHGYLVSQFLSPLTNLRDDAYGGDATRRRRFLLDVVAAIRAEVGPTFPIAVKLNSADFQRGGFDEAESLAVVRALGEAGIDLIEISGGTYEQPAMTGAKQSTRDREAYFLAFAEKVREVSDLPLMLTGGFRTRAVMADAIASGKVDVVGLARPLALNPDLPNALLADRAGADPITLRRTGIAALDGIAEVAWYGWQIRAMARGEEPRPDLTTLRATGSYLVSQITGMVCRRSSPPLPTLASRAPGPA